MHTNFDDFFPLRVEICYAIVLRRYLYVMCLLLPNRGLERDYALCTTKVSPSPVVIARAEDSPLFRQFQYRRDLPECLQYE